MLRPILLVTLLFFVGAPARAADPELPQAIGAVDYPLAPGFSFDADFG